MALTEKVLKAMFDCTHEITISGWGAFTFYVDRGEGGRGFGKVYACLRRGREGYVRCLRRQNPF